MNHRRVLFFLPNNDIGGHTKFILNLGLKLEAEGGQYTCSYYVPWLTHFRYTKKFRANHNKVLKTFIWCRYFLGQLKAEVMKRRLKWMGQRLCIGTPSVLRYFSQPSMKVLSRFDFVVVLGYYQIEELVELGFDKRRIVYVIHHLGFTRIEQIDAELFEPIFRIAVSSRQTAQKCLEMGIKNFEICSLGVDTDLFSPFKKSTNSNRTRIGFFFYNHRRKNPELIEELVFRVIDKFPLCEIRIYGNGFRKTHMNIMIEENLNEADYANSIANLDFFVYVSRLEGFGLPPLECMASAVPVISSKVGAVSEYLTHGEQGFLVDDGAEIEQWLNYIEKLTVDHVLRKKMGANARRRAENWSWSRTTKQYIQLFDQISVDIPKIQSKLE